MMRTTWLGSPRYDQGSGATTPGPRGLAQLGDITKGLRRIRLGLDHVGSHLIGQDQGGSDSLGFAKESLHQGWRGSTNSWREYVSEEGKSVSSCGGGNLA